MRNERMLKKSETESLTMARQALGRAKEMDLTPADKEKILAMIDKAKAAEKEGNKSKALNVYLELKKYLEDISVYCKDKIKVKQIEKIQKIISDMGDESAITEEQKWRLDLLLNQINFIKTPEENKYDESINYGEIELLPVTQFTIGQITEFISKIENLDKDEFFLISVIANENDDITWIDFGVAGNIDYVYTYIPAQLQVGDNGEKYVSDTGSDTVIHKTDVDLETGDWCGYEVIARWSEERKKWEDDDGNEIKV